MCKEDNAATTGKYRPIALCNVIYKIIFKVIANRLKAILPNLISLEQSCYVEGRQILDGIILAHEAIHSINCLKLPDMLIKLNLFKAFETLNWDYIK